MAPDLLACGIALVDLGTIACTVTQHRLVVLEGVRVWWTDLRLAWDAMGRLVARCLEKESGNRFEWAGEFFLPLAEPLPLIRVARNETSL